MDRRKVLGYLAALSVFGIYSNRLQITNNKAVDIENLTPAANASEINLKISTNSLSQIVPANTGQVINKEIVSTKIVSSSDDDVVDYLYKIQHFNKDFNTDIYLDDAKYFVLKRLSRRLNRAQTVIGYMNFSILDFPLLVKYSKNYPAIGRFTTLELDLVEELVFRPAVDYGFFGDKLIGNLNNKIEVKHLSKISGSGQYLYKSQATVLFKRIQQDVGKRVILTSGVRGLMKQLQLFTAKAVKTNGNLSRASRSLAPPGHSYHGIGDFDIGDISLGKLNFTRKFSDTSIYKELVDLGYLKIRYQTDNQFGVRYEPWHIKVS